MIITEMMIDASYNNDEFNMNYIVEKLSNYLDEKNIDYEWNKNNAEEQEGEYKGYIFYIDGNYKAHIDGKIKGVKPKIKAEVQTEGYVLEGNAVEIQVVASITSGTVKIIAPDEMIPINIISENENEKVYIYRVYENKDYTFMAEGDSGRNAKKIVSVKSIIDKPQINISDNKGTEITVNVINNYPDDVNITYQYYLDSAKKTGMVEDKSYIIDDLTENTKYTAKVMIFYDGNQIMSDGLEFTTKIILNPPITSMMSLEENITKTAIEYPILKVDGVMNCIVDCKVGDKIRIELGHVDEGVTNYYSIDGGENWEEYKDIIEMEYPGNGLLKAKSVNDVTTSEIKDIIPYDYDETINCTGTDGITKNAYDRDYKTYFQHGNYEAVLQVDHECWERYVTLYIQCKDHAIGSYWYGTLGYYNWRNKQIGERGYIDKLIGSSIMQVLSAKSLKMPKNTHRINIGVGTMGRYISLYEVWCSEENLTGRVY